MRRPEPAEYAPFYGRYVALTRGANHQELLRDSCESLLNTLADLSNEQAEKAYAEGKWTLKELMQHVLDTDLIFAYRALRISRMDHTPLPGFDQDTFVQNSNANQRSLAAILADFSNLRNYILGFYHNLTEAQLDFQGSMNGNTITARALAFVMAGHCFHHLEIIKTRYL
jgi:uncharacterized damage-inducible protein DinB